MGTRVLFKVHSGLASRSGVSLGPILDDGGTKGRPAALYPIGPLSDLSVCLSVLSVCDVGVLWTNGWMDQDATWYGGRPRPRRHYVRWGPAPLTESGIAAPHFSAHFALARSPISATAELLFHISAHTYTDLETIHQVHRRELQDEDDVTADN